MFKCNIVQKHLIPLDDPSILGYVGETGYGCDNFHLMDHSFVSVSVSWKKCVLDSKVYICLHRNTKNLSLNTMVNS